MILVFADLHLHFDSKLGGIKRLMDGFHVLREMTEFAEKNHIDTIISLGDLTEKKDHHDGLLLNLFSTWLNYLEEKNIRFITLLGNHDYSIRKNPPLKALFTGRKKHLFIDEVTKIDDWLFIPYTGDFSNVENLEYSGSIVFFHEEVPGIFKPDRRLKLQKNVVYIGGHIHEHGYIKDNLLYVGPPYQITTAEAGQDKGFITIGDKIEFVKLNSPKFVEVSLDGKGDIKGNYVKVKGELEYEEWQAFNKKKMEEELKEKGAEGVFFDITRKQRKVKKKHTSIDEMIEEYAKKNKNELKLDMLTSIGKEVFYGETLE